MQPPNWGVGSRGGSLVSDPLEGFAVSAVALLPEEPAGRVSTVSAGAALFEAFFSPGPGDGFDKDGLLLEIPNGSPSGARYFSPTQETDPASLSYRLSCEVRALSASALAAGLDSLLRSVSTHAAFADAVLETRVVRLATPTVYPAPLVQSLARDLWDAGFPVTFGPTWTPAPVASVAVGTSGHQSEMESFLRDYLAWQYTQRVSS